jgi:hypothetical protein
MSVSHVCEYLNFLIIDLVILDHVYVLPATYRYPSDSFGRVRRLLLESSAGVWKGIYSHLYISLQGSGYGYVAL